MADETYYHTKDVLKKVKISRNTLFLWLKKGKIPEVARDRNGHRIFTEADIKKILNYKNCKFDPHEFKKKRKG